MQETKGNGGRCYQREEVEGKVDQSIWRLPSPKQKRRVVPEETKRSSRKDVDQQEQENYLQNQKGQQLLWGVRGKKWVDYPYFGWNILYKDFESRM